MFINVNYDCQQFHQYQQSEQLHIDSNYWTQKDHDIGHQGIGVGNDHDIGHQGIGVGNAQNCGEV